MNQGHVQPLSVQSAEEIRTRAYFLWLDRGCPQGQHHTHWLEAERLQQRAAAHVVDPAHHTIRMTVAANQSDPAHHYHSPASAHDDRVKVAAGEAPQRIRGRHFGGSLRPQAKPRA
ncbi:MAG: Protein of unknown function (DUF2934) [Verrucomicrobia bacterium]|nr:MAG: Protein of unknown function (DUF2934) [Verrucomicrobiota bacterium]